MMRYVALLRGINVNGITVAMNDLVATFEGLGYSDVKTVVASGNVVFTVDEAAEASPDAIKSRIEAALSERFDYEAWIVLIDEAELAREVRSYPFPEREGWHAYVMFGSDPSHLAELAGHSRELDQADERIELGHGVLYWEVRRAVGIKSAFSKKSAKVKYRATTTTRNLNTLQKIITL
ncbi:MULTISPECIES: DUF1697 domain-containing protein [unclassified Cryobacterium]|uniref:DUF1697 domain-containing protein n=1 Tax=unclassified Cryobacterium TaxID=2649013 RepID=UPI002AB59C12|nr:MULTISPECIES: DUF1697 domain-containing protein [unclassified Cryobacterium]MDY7544078.1 DUF1697 domain-containing protein [Cryobacterium sp. 5B3]MEA9997934.1 DUF1697 domain-containing protein [Cryobacterium sp. RTS3]MEB0265212.1 DUF1697 domain-containing protein [Cryobacterium sp. 10I5]MEB0273265.1 DUF1697 domain-containing protein [Cryobacterium sp. 5B3]